MKSKKKGMSSPMIIIASSFYGHPPEVWRFARVLGMSLVMWNLYEYTSRFRFSRKTDVGIPMWSRTSPGLKGSLYMWTCETPYAPPAVLQS